MGRPKADPGENRDPGQGISFQKLLKCGSVHEADSGYRCGNLRHAVAEGNFRVPTSVSLEKPFAQRAVVEAKPIAAFEQLSHAP